uniref:holo-[acyl-carrier-protein] synthase n=1 Tax=Megaselia scalaris TaxID=36166 RepID=T1H3P4_MEGSC
MTEIVRWAVNLKNFRPNKDELIRAVSCIQDHEKSRLMKFVYRDDFDSSFVGKLLQRKFVNEFGKVAYSGILFFQDLKGKPFINHDLSERIKFNVSHQGDYTVLAGLVADSSPDSGIGVDIMKVEYTGGKPLD